MILVGVDGILKIYDMRNNITSVRQIRSSLLETSTLGHTTLHQIRSVTSFGDQGTTAGMSYYGPFRNAAGWATSHEANQLVDFPSVLELPNMLR